MESQDIEVNRDFVQGKRFVVLEDDELVFRGLEPVSENNGR